jgi:hypothetical protein
MAPSASPFGYRLLRTSRERFSIRASCGSSSWSVGPAATRWRSRGVCARTTPTGSTSAGRIIKEKQSFAPSWLLGGIGMGCRIVAVQYTTLEIEYTADALRQTHHGVMLHLLECEGYHRYALHWSEDPTPRLLVHRQHQQDALRHSWDGLVVGTDGSVDERTEVMGAASVNRGVLNLEEFRTHTKFV